MKIREEFLPFALPSVSEHDVQAVVTTLTSRWWSKGPRTIEFEQRFADYVGARYAVAVNSGTAALHLALLTKGIGKGDEVITTPFTFVSTVNTIVHTGAKPVFVDIDPETGLIDVNRIEEKITEKTKAIVPVHFAGQVCEMDKILELAKKYHLFVSEDAAHAVYSTYKGRRVGSIGDATSFSFYSTKNLAVGEGGMLTTDDDMLAEKARVLSLNGMEKNAWNRYNRGGAWRYDVMDLGYKYNMYDLTASIGLSQLERLEEMQAKREKYAAIYSRAFSHVKGIRPLQQVLYGTNSWYLYVIRVDQNQLNITRDEFIERLAEYNIGTGVHFIPVHHHTFYQKNFPVPEGILPGADTLFSQVISLPLYPDMTEDDAYYVAQAVEEIARKYAK